MNTRETGGPAFPSVLYSHKGVENWATDGMDLRDYFAGQAIAGFMSQSHAGPKDWTNMGHGWGEDCANSLNRHDKSVVKTLAAFAYAVADAMLEARKATGAAS